MCVIYFRNIPTVGSSFDWSGISVTARWSVYSWHRSSFNDLLGNVKFVTSGILRSEPLSFYFFYCL